MKNHSSPIYGIVADEGSQIDVVKCEISGNKNKDTLGLICKWADVKIQNCGINLHQLGGCMILSHIYNTIEIFNSKFENNAILGLQCLGQNSSPSIYQNLFENNQGSGIIIGIANQAKVLRNTIKLNINGIICQSCNPLIMHNKIWKNQQNGVYTCCLYNFRQDSVIKRNEISCNEHSGILCEGDLNFTKIQENPFIGFNKLSGIIADKNAQIIVQNNLISRNIQQGILLVESSSAKIEKNRINSNLKAGIALGGHNSVDTYIIDNQISGGSREGIYIIDGGEIWIIRNKIFNNQDGIVLTNSIPLIENNDILLNKGSGVMTLKKSMPKIIGNNLQDNDGIGLFLRDKFCGTVKDNRIFNNEIDFAAEKYIKNIKQILLENQIEDNTRFHTNNKCLIQ